MDAETAGGACTLLVAAENDGLAVSEGLHLLWGNLRIDVRADGIRVGTGGPLTVSAGRDRAGEALRADGDLTVTGRTLTLLSSGRALPAGGKVLLDGGAVTAADHRSARDTLSLSFFAAQPTGARLTVRDTDRGLLLDYTAVRPFSDALISAPGLDRARIYTVSVDGLPQRHSGGVETMAFGSAAFALPDGAGTYAGLTGFGRLPFAEVDPDDARYDSVRYVYGVGIMNGVSSEAFAPDAPVDRAMAVTVLGRLAGVAGSGTDAFSDVAPGDWYSGYVGWAVSAGIVQGDGKGHFLPGDAVTGEQMGLMLSRFARQAGWSYDSANTSPAPLSRGELAGMLLAFSRGA